MHTLSAPEPGPQRLSAAQLAVCSSGQESGSQAVATHLAVYWSPKMESGAAAGTDGSQVAVYQLSGEAARGLAARCRAAGFASCEGCSLLFASVLFCCRWCIRDSVAKPSLEAVPTICSQRDESACETACLLLVPWPVCASIKAFCTTQHGPQWSRRHRRGSASTSCCNLRQTAATSRRRGCSRTAACTCWRPTAALAPPPCSRKRR